MDNNQEFYLLSTALSLLTVIAQFFINLWNSRRGTSDSSKGNGDQAVS